MSHRHLVDADLLPMIEHEFLPGLSGANLKDARATVSRMFLEMGGRSPAIRSEVYVPTRDGSPEVHLVIQTPPGDAKNRPAVLYMHGGGMVLGDAAMGEGADGALALRHDAVVVSVDYRLAPEAPFPAAINDCFAALKWLFATAASLGIDDRRIALMGHSAGGGLAAALAQMARDEGGGRPCAQFLVYPMLDCRTGGEDDPHPNPVTGEFGWTRAHNRFAWSSLAGTYAPDDARAGYFSAALGRDLSDLPPAFMAVGTLDLFYDETVEYSRRLNHAGVPAALHVYPGAIHGFDSMRDAWMSKELEQSLNGAMSRALRSTNRNLEGGGT